ncbi:MAG: hypothetical protein DRG09_06935 [Epsilonproteobacteria bacterium]|nr:MAG: hypothetical protein DRG09_06935 [Campylobacterota bacterium]
METVVLGNMTKVGVGVGPSAVTFEPICVFGGEAIVDFGGYTTNKEYCLSKAEPYVALNDLEFGSATYSYLWSEADGDAGNKIFKDAHLAKTLAAKTVSIETEVNNTLGVNGTQYTADFIVAGYKFLFKKGEVNKVEVTLEQLTTPVEVIASAT